MIFWRDYDRDYNKKARFTEAQVKRMKRYPLVITLLAAIVWAGEQDSARAVTASSPAPETSARSSAPVVDLVRKNYSGAVSIRADFTMQIYWSVREKSETRQGQAWMAPGDRFRVALGNDTYVSDGKILYSYNKKNRQLVIKNLSQVSPSSRPSNFLSSFIGEYPFREKKREQGEAANELAVLEWISDMPGEGEYKAITVWVEPSAGIIKKIKIDDRNDNVTTYTFGKTSMGKAIPKEVFRFATPQGARVEDMRE